MFKTVKKAKIIIKRLCDLSTNFLQRPIVTTTAKIKTKI
jgi:hypothetical protein